MTDHFLINKVSEMTGLSTQVIRKWEDRYSLIQPSRQDNGYRLYSKDDIHTLLKIKALREQGHSVQKAIDIYESEKAVEDQTGRAEKGNVGESHYVNRMLESGAVYDEATLTLLLKQAHHEFGLDLFLQNTIKPFLLKVGKQWATKEWDESQEAISSLVIRDFLAQIARHFDHAPDAPLALGCCLPGEKHEIPLQMILLRMNMQGWKTIFAGASPSFKAIEQLVARLKPKKVLLSASTRQPFEEDPMMFDKLVDIARSNPDVTFYLGGVGALDYEIIYQSDWLTFAKDMDDVLSHGKRADEGSLG
ncbi:MerR family transcriptional regulator [Lentibacillus saliphilus]|uniref:MerR family transcriptional regulator n=1 Tax=Lentibacillus saliphilus TaxID=2737028 RepID=UPI001C2F9737|nr:MerR family transcriptional regulator [Lentibacillus saliphilus]